jgi:hypothetical protein
MRIVSPYQPFPVARHSQEGFDWIAALQMLRASAAHAGGWDVVALTEHGTPLPGPVFAYATGEARLMLWILGVSLAYLSSPQFDQDTVLLSPDTLVVGDLQPGFAADLTVLVRPLPRYALRPVLNVAQWWPVAAKAQLIAFYQQTLAVARTLPPNIIEWGADCEALRLVLAPIRPGVHRRMGLTVSLQPAARWLRGVNPAIVAAFERVPSSWGPTPIVDFKYHGKPLMPRFFAALDQSWRRDGREARSA